VKVKVSLKREYVTVADAPEFRRRHKTALVDAVGDKRVKLFVSTRLRAMTL
jgi:hypothetical protein